MIEQAALSFPPPKHLCPAIVPALNVLGMLTLSSSKRIGHGWLCQSHATHNINQPVYLNHKRRRCFSIYWHNCVRK
jgi:hypothetical protein